jgi:hypothetical protein
MQAFVGAGERIQRKFYGSIADLPVDFTIVAASAPDGSDAAKNLLALCGRRATPGLWLVVALTLPSAWRLHSQRPRDIPC